MFSKIAFGNVRKSSRDFGIYFLTTVLAIAIFYAFNSITDQEAMSFLSETGNMIDLLGIVIQGVSVFILIILFFLVLYANRFLLRRRKKEFGMYMCLGMRRSDVIKITLLESAMVGAASLVCGLALGIACSQVLMNITALLFKADIPGFVFGISQASLAKTALAFALIFLCAALLNSGMIMKTRIIDLLKADRRNEDMKLRNLPLSIALFVISLAIIAVAYKLLLDNGLAEPSVELAISTVLVCIGTALFFYSLSGFLLRLVQMVKPLYLRSLNMFTLRQLNSKINTASASMTVICMTLFLAITSVCGGIAICNAVTANLDKTTAYDASVRTYYGTYSFKTGFVPEDFGDRSAYADSFDGDMQAGLRESIDSLGYDFDALVEQCAQIDFLVDPEGGISYGSLDEISDRPLSSYVSAALSSNYQDLPLDIVSLSQINAVLEMAGKPPIELAEGEAAIISDSDITQDYWTDLCKKEPTFTVGTNTVRVVGYNDTTLETTSFPINTGALVVRDEIIPDSAISYQSILDVITSSEEAQISFGEACSDISQSVEQDMWPISIAMTRNDVFEQSVGLSTVVAFLAVYIGFVLVIACAAILAIQQLSEASDNAKRYKLLGKLGASKGMLNAALFTQIAIYFCFPLLLALAHSACALVVVVDLVAIFGHMDIGVMAGTCAAAFLATYGIYFICTYVGAKGLIRAQPNAR